MKKTTVPSLIAAMVGRLAASPARPMHPTSRAPRRTLGRAFALGASCLCLSLLARAQVAPPPAPAAGDPIKLSVFEVSSEKDTGYAASTAMTGTRTNELLENLPNSISVMTQELLQDLAFNNYFDAVDFAMSTENQFNDQGTVGGSDPSENPVSYQPPPQNRVLAVTERNSTNFAPQRLTNVVS